MGVSPLLARKTKPAPDGPLSIHEALDEIMLHGILAEEGPVSFVYANERCEEWYGMSVEALLRSPHLFVEHIHGEDRGLFEASIEKARGQRTSWEWEGRLVNPRGGYRWIRVACSPQEGSEGLRWNGFFLDVTETGRAAKENETLQGLSWLLSTHMSEQELHMGVARILCETLGFPVACLDIGEGIDALRHGVYGLGNEEALGAVRPAEGSVAMEVLGSGIVYECPDTQGGGTSYGADPLVQMGARAILCVPILQEGRVLGAITLLDWQRRKLEASLRVTVETVATLLGQQMANREAELQFQESIKRFDLALEGTSDGLWDVKLDATTEWSISLPMYFSRRFTELLGVVEGKLEPTLGAWSSRVLPEDMPRVGRIFWGHVQARTPFDIEHRLLMSDGSLRWFNVRGQGLWDESGTLIRMAGSLRDITSRKEMESALQRSQREYRMLVERLPEGVAIIQRGVLAYANTSLIKTLRHADGTSLMRRPIAELVVAEDRELMEYLVDEEVTKMSCTAREVRFLDACGQEVTLEVAPVKKVSFRGAEGVLITGRDITEKKEMEAKLYLADRMTSMGTIAAGMAHEINNPLSFLSGNLDYLLDELEDMEDKENDVVRIRSLVDALNDARQGAHRVARIVRDLKTFSRLEEERREVLNVREVLDSTLVMAENHLRHRVTVVRNSETVPAIWGCSSRLGQVFLNLVLNAAQSFEDDDPEENRIEINLITGESGTVSIRIADNGVGIPEHSLRRIYDPFFTTKPSGLGTGLGLSICHQLVLGMGGEIRVESSEGVGTSFEVIFPVANSSGAPEPIAPIRLPVEAVTAKTRSKVLIIDDEKQVGETLIRGLKGHDVTATTRGKDAIELIRNGTQFDVVFCDVMMPEMTGMDMHARLKELDPILASNVVFMTGGAFTPRAQLFLDSVENRVIEKPFDLRAIQALVASASLP